MVVRQTSFDLLEECPVACSERVDAAIASLADSGGKEERGAIFTRQTVVGFILDLAGYTADRPLHTMRLLEPSFGGGDFLLPVIGRLLAAWRATGARGTAVDVLGHAIFAVELHRNTYQTTRAGMVSFLQGEGLDIDTAEGLADRWLHQGDFLMSPIKGPFDEWR